MSSTIPEPARSWVERDAAVVWHGFTQMATYADNAPLVIERAEGHELVDTQGRRYLDAISSLWVNTLGHHVPELDAALAAQAGKVAHSTMLGNGNTVVVELAETLAALVPVDDAHFLFAADGAVAVEQALKIAFQYWVNRGVRGRTQFLALGDAYHGDTIGSLSLGDGGVFSAVFEPLCFPVVRTPGYADPGWADKACAAITAHAGELAAVVLEPLVQGAAGILVADPDDVRRVGDACRKTGVLLVCDEVATGFGRTGTLFASEQCGLRPDLLCLGKGITGGYLAMSASAASGRVFDAFLGADLGSQTFYHGHSYGGNALAAAVALEHLNLVESRDVLANVRARGTQLADLLARRVASNQAVHEVRQRGLMVGVELAPPRDGLRWGRRVCAGAVERGVLLRPLGDVVVLMPPLTITEDEVVRIVDALAEALDEVTGPS
ncbi:MAG TPA: adenosylmethionine--8-amino-7-oxononanoate transaminase [Acidimicrobiales bacterium]|nr:adenosylmethionine--8-amino-7-oxononanoate transaminase [Acidimicrobiales bacterium]